MLGERSGITGFGEDMREHLARVEQANGEALDRISKEMLRVVHDDGLIYVTGTGHSIALLLETFYRAGGLACVVPLYHPALLPLHGGAASTVLERVPGFASVILEQTGAGPNDIAFIFSNSGVNFVPVELAEGLHARGTKVVSVCSLTHLRKAPARAGRKIDEIADVVLDTMVPYGDSVYPVSDGTTAAGMSTLSGIYLWNLLLVRLVEGAAAEGLHLPVWTSANVADGEVRNRALLASYRRRIPQL